MFYIIFSIKTLEEPVRPYMPNIIHAGGIHCKEAGPLPQVCIKTLLVALVKNTNLFNIETLVFVLL